MVQNSDILWSFDSIYDSKRLVLNDILNFQDVLSFQNLFFTLLFQYMCIAKYNKLPYTFRNTRKDDKLSMYHTSKYIYLPCLTLPKIITCL